MGRPAFVNTTPGPRSVGQSPTLQRAVTSCDAQRKQRNFAPSPRARPLLYDNAVKLLFALLFSAVLVGCPSSGVSPEDGGGADAGVVAQDARGPSDLGAQDLGEAGAIDDAGLLSDGGAVDDAGLVSDAGAVDDAGVFADTGAVDDAGLVDDAGVAADTGAVDDAGVGADTGAALDAGVASDSGVAGADAGCSYPPLAIDGPFRAGPPPASAHLLLTDTSSNAIFRVDLSGALQTQWRSPVARVYGVAHDLRTTDGFWVAGYPIVGIPGANRPFRRLSFAGAVTATLTYSFFSQDGFHGLDFALGSDASRDVLVFTMQNRNIIDTVSGAQTTDGSRAFEGGGLESSSRWFGMQVERYGCDDANSLVFWTTQTSSLVLREWSTGTVLRTYALPSTDARGLTRTPYGDFYVVDGAQRRVLHLDAQGALLGAFGTPGPTPADLSYGE